MPPSTAVVAGALASKAGYGGEAWVRLNWVLGLRRLGFDVVFVEAGRDTGPGTAAVRYFEAVTRRFGIERAALLHRGGSLAGASIEAILACDKRRRGSSSI